VPLTIFDNHGKAIGEVKGGSEIFRRYDISLKIDVGYYRYCGGCDLNEAQFSRVCVMFQMSHVVIIKNR
jgi:hypothetical protein